MHLPDITVTHITCAKKQNNCKDIEQSESTKIIQNGAKMSIKPVEMIMILATLATTYAGPTNHCTDAALDVNQVDKAYWSMRNRADANGRVWLDGRKSAFAYNGNTQFYICNNAYKRRYFTIDQAQKTTVANNQNSCGGNGFWTMNDDKWSYGIDLRGASECGPGIDPQ